MTITYITLFLLIILVLYLFKKINFYSRNCKDAAYKRFQNDLMLNAIDYGVYTVDKNGYCSFVNESALEILNVSKIDILYKNIQAVFCRDILKSSTYTKESCPVFKTLEDKKKRVVKEHFVTNNGNSIHLSLSISPFEDDSVIVVFKDITAEVSILQELSQKNIELDKLAITDGLSGLYNRRYFDKNLQREYEIAQRVGISFIVGICDIDNFKLYNDNYGHLKGDEVIRLVSDILKHTFNRQTDIVARYGGEEFVFILSGVSKDNALKLIQKAKKDIEDLKIEHLFSGSSKYITMSFGVVRIDINSNNISAEDLLNMADLALYNSKKNGKNMITFESI